MSAQILDGRAISKNILAELKNKTSRLVERGYRVPNLAVILVGDDEASKIYIRNKVKASEKVGMQSQTFHLAENTNPETLEAKIRSLNEDDSVDGILLQLPLPKHLADYEADFLELIRPDKDVDGFHPLNIGNLTLGKPSPISCTPAGCMKLIEATNTDISGKICLILGRSNSVGKPLIQLLLRKNATVISCNSYTKNLEALTKQADLIIAAIGKAEFLKANMLKEGSIVIDVGINRLENGKLVGDVEFEEAKMKASYITPVPGGVGPMTIAMLIQNTYDCYNARKGILNA